MKKVFVSIMIAAAIAFSGAVSAQDAEKKETCEKQKTECCKKKKEGARRWEMVFCTVLARTKPGSEMGIHTTSSPKRDRAALSASREQVRPFAKAGCV